MESALIGSVEVLIGILITEYFRKRNRIENYSHKKTKKIVFLHEKMSFIKNYCKKMIFL